MKPDRSAWEEIPVNVVWPPLRGMVTITISDWQEADAYHRACYDTGGIVIELDEHETPVRAYASPEAWAREQREQIKALTKDFVMKKKMVEAIYPVEIEVVKG